MEMNSLDEKELRKAWLKQHFTSYDYRVLLLKIHQQWIDIIRSALTRACAEEDARHGVPHPTDLLVSDVFEGPKKRVPAATHFRKVFLPKIENVPPPEAYTKAMWEAHPGTSGGVRAVGDYGRYIGTPDHWVWMTPDEKAELDRVWAQMVRTASNIRQTIDRLWEDDILNERYTGPITWPSDWKQDLLGERGVLLEQSPAPRVKAGEPVTVAGTYEAIDRNERRFKVNVGDVLPDFGSAYGITIWVRVGD